MNKSKSSLNFNISQTEGNNYDKSTKNILFNSTLPNIRTNIINGFFYESSVEKYNEKINLWQNAFIIVKRNYLYLYDKKPKLFEKPKEYLFLNNKITLTFHKKLFKMKAIKCFVVNFKINNEALSKSLIEDNKHNLFISFKTQKNYDNFEKVIDNVLKLKQFTNSVSPNQIGITKKEKIDKIEKREKTAKKSIKKNNISTNKKMNKNLTSIHLKNKSMNEITINKSLIFSDRSNENTKKNLNKKEIIENINKENSQSLNNNIINTNSANKTNNSIHNVFTFSKVENINNITTEKKLVNSKSTNKSKSQSQRQSNSSNNDYKKINNNKISNLSINDNNIFLDKNNFNNTKRNINYFTVNFSQKNSMSKNNNIFDRDESDLTLPDIPKLVYSIKRKNEKEKEDIINFRKHRTKSCYGFNLKNILFQKEEKEDKIKEIKINLKDFNSFSNTNYIRKRKINLQNYIHEEKNISVKKGENQDNSETTNLSLFQQDQNILNDIEEEKNITESKSKKDNNNNMSFGSLKSFKSESKPENNSNNTNNNNDYFEGLNIYSYVDASETTKNISNVEDSNPISSLNIPNIRNQIANIIKENEEKMTERENNDNSDVIFTPRLMEEIKQHDIISGPNSKEKGENEIQKEKHNDEEENNTNRNSNNNSKIEISSNQSGTNIINTSIARRKNDLRFSKDLNELIQSLDNKNSENYQSNQSFVKHNDSNSNDIDLNNSLSKSESYEKEKSLFSDKINKRLEVLEKHFKYKNTDEKYEEKKIFEKKCKLSIPINSFFNVNMSFYFMDFNFNFLGNDKSGIKDLLYKIDNNLIFIYDSNILNLLLKKLKNNIQYETSTMANEIKGKLTKNKILGKIYESLNNKNVKYFLLCEMIAIISKKELSKLIITSIEIFNKKKEINLNEPIINFDEYIYDIFNKYLSRNEKNNDYITLYENILPKEIRKIFEIEDSDGSLINIIKQNIHPFTLFNSMQYHNKIYININLENNSAFNFNSLKPFDKKNNHYMSPYVLEKWKFKASLNNTNNNLNENNTCDININNNYNLNSTNPINESFDSNSNYSRDMSNTSLSCIVLDKNNKFRVSLISKNNELSINNNLIYDLVKTERNIYEEYKVYEKTEEMQKINLFQNIILNINQNDLNSAMNNCEYFLQK